MRRARGSFPPRIARSSRTVRLKAGRSSCGYEHEYIVYKNEARTAPSLILEPLGCRAKDRHDPLRLDARLGRIVMQRERLRESRESRSSCANETRTRQQPHVSVPTFARTVTEIQARSDDEVLVPPPRWKSLLINQASLEGREPLVDRANLLERLARPLLLAVSAVTSMVASIGQSQLDIRDLLVEI